MGKLAVVDALTHSESIVLTTHVSPDGDALGSLCSLGNLLKRMGKTTQLVIEDQLPDRFDYLPGFCDIHNSIAQIPFDTVVVLDCGTKNRVALSHWPQGKTVINIDHHSDNTLFGDINWLDTSAAAVGEMIYVLAEALGMGLSLDEATAVYSAIITDTGCFKYSNTTAKTHTIASQLFDLGVDHEMIVELAIVRRSMASLLLLREVLLTGQVENQIGILVLTQEALAKTQAPINETEGLVNHILAVDDVQIAIMFTEVESNTIKISLRSKGCYDVSRLAAQFGGGGHPRAAGCTITGSLDEVKDRLLTTAQVFLKENQ